MKLYEAIAQNARILSDASSTHYEAALLRQERLDNLLPSGSGFDQGTSLVSASCNKIVFTTSFHHMDENGFYDGWTDHTITIKPSLITSFDVNVSGRDKREIKNYIAEVFNDLLNDEFDWMN